MTRLTPGVREREHKIWNTTRQIEQALDHLKHWQKTPTIERILAGLPCVIVEEDAQSDRLIVQGAAVGSIYILRNSTWQIKLDTGWRAIAASRNEMTDEMLDKLSPEVAGPLYEAAERELDEQFRFVERLKKRNERKP